MEPDSPHAFMSCGEDGAVLQLDLRDSRATTKYVHVCVCVRVRVYVCMCVYGYMANGSAKVVYASTVLLLAFILS